MSDDRIGNEQTATKKMITAPSDVFAVVSWIVRKLYCIFIKMHNMFSEAQSFETAVIAPTQWLEFLKFALIFFERVMMAECRKSAMVVASIEELFTNTNVADVLLFDVVVELCLADTPTGGNVIHEDKRGDGWYAYKKVLAPKSQHDKLARNSPSEPSLFSEELESLMIREKNPFKTKPEDTLGIHLFEMNFRAFSSKEFIKTFYGNVAFKKPYTLDKFDALLAKDKPTLASLTPFFKAVVCPQWKWPKPIALNGQSALAKLGLGPWPQHTIMKALMKPQNIVKEEQFVRSDLGNALATGAYTFIFVACTMRCFGHVMLFLVDIVEETTTAKLFGRNFHKKFCVESSKKYVYVPPLEHIPSSSSSSSEGNDEPEANEHCEKKTESDEWNGETHVAPQENENEEEDEDKAEAEQFDNAALEIHNALFGFSKYDMKRIMNRSCDWTEEIIKKVFGEKIDAAKQCNRLFLAIKHLNAFMQTCMQKYLGMTLEFMDEIRDYVKILEFAESVQDMVGQLVSSAASPKKSRKSFLFSDAEFEKKDPSNIYNWERFLYDTTTQAKLMHQITQFVKQLRHNPKAECIPLSVLLTVLYCAAHALGSGLLPPIKNVEVKHDETYQLKSKTGQTSKEGCTNRIQYTLHHDWLLSAEALAIYKVKDSMASNVLTGVAGFHNHELKVKLALGDEGMEQQDIVVNTLVSD